MSTLNEQLLVFVAPQIFKLNRAKCVHTMPQKGGPRPKPVPGRDCPSLKLRLSTPGVREQLGGVITDLLHRVVTTERSRKKSTFRSDVSLFYSPTICRSETFMQLRNVETRILRLQNCEMFGQAHKTYFRAPIQSVTW